MSETFGDRFEQVMGRIRAAAERAGREPQEVLLLGASKYMDVERLREAYEGGLSCFGENRVQELKVKAPMMPQDCEWHFIGALQTNKVRDAVKFATTIHSVDRVELIEEIEKRAEQLGRFVRVLIEVNVGGESSKHGASPDEAQALVERVNDSGRMEIVGLMAVAPFYEDLEQVRPFFRRLRELRDEVQQKTGFVLPELSMGMSHDFEVAIEEGATIVRIGSLLFGPRNRK